MPGTITTDLSTISAANSTSDSGTWTKVAGGTLAVEPDAKIEGANCLTLPTGTTVSPNDSGVYVNLTATFDSTGKHVFIWRSTSTPSNLNTKANQGVVIHLTSDTAYANPGTNYKKWYVDGSDTYPYGGWKCYAVDPSSTPSASGGTLSTTAIKNVASIWRMQTSTATTFKNSFYDAVRLGTGLTIVDGTAGSPVTLADIYATDSLNANAWGILTFNASIYFGAGKFYFGALSPTGVTYFKDTNKVLVFNDYPVANTFYEIIVRGSSSYATTFQLGNYSGGLASDGCTIKGAGDTASSSHAVWTLTGNNAYGITKLYSSAFSEMRRGAFNSASEMRYCSFTNFGDLTTNGALIDNCTFQNVKTTAPISGAYGLIINGTTEVNDKISNSKFINCNRAIKITAAGEYNFSNLTFSGNSYDIENSSAGVVTINALGTSNPSTYINTGGGSTSIISAKTLSITSLVVGTEVHVYRASDLYEYTGTEATSGTTFTWGYNADNTEIFITLIKPGYKWVRYNGLTLSSSGISIIATQQADLGYSNPP